MKKTMIHVVDPDGNEATYVDWSKLAEDICAIETGKGRVTNEILNNFHRCIRTRIDKERIIYVFAYCLGYKIEVSEEA